MPNTKPPLQDMRVRPLWERHKLFREPEFATDLTWNGEDDEEEEDAQQPVR